MTTRTYRVDKLEALDKGMVGVRITYLSTGKFLDFICSPEEAKRRVAPVTDPAASGVQYKNISRLIQEANRNLQTDPRP